MMGRKRKNAERLENPEMAALGGILRVTVLFYILFCFVYTNHSDQNNIDRF